MEISRFSDSEKLDGQIYLIAIVRLISSITSGFTLFCAPVYFIEKVGLEGSLVGIGIGAGGAASIAGRLLGGSAADSAKFGRKLVMLVSLVFMTLGAMTLSMASTFPFFVLGIVCTGLGFGLFSPAADALIADLTRDERINEAFAFNRLANWLGLGAGLILGSLLIKFTGAYMLLFGACSLVYLGILLISIKAISKKAESVKESAGTFQKRWKDAVKDTRLLSYLFLNIGMSNNVLLVMSAIPLFLMNCIREYSNFPFADTGVLGLFSCYLVICACSQMPIAKWTAKSSKVKLLVSASLLWSLTYFILLVSASGFANPLLLSVVSVILLAIASTIYGPASSSFMVSIAPEDSRALYMSINSLCWGVARLIGPSIGLLMVDSGLESASVLWFGLALFNLLILAPGLLALAKAERTPVSQPVYVGK